jgi:hypothetical protein
VLEQRVEVVDGRVSKLCRDRGAFEPGTGLLPSRGGRLRVCTRIQTGRRMFPSHRLVACGQYLRQAQRANGTVATPNVQATALVGHGTDSFVAVCSGS